MHLATHRLLLGTLVLISIPILLPGQLLPLDWHPLLIATALSLGPVRWFTEQVIKDKAIQNCVRRYSLPTDWPLYLLLLWLPINLWSSVDQSASWIAIGYLVLGTTFYTNLVPLLLASLSQEVWLEDHQPAALYYLGYVFVFGGLLLAIVFPFIVVWKPQFRLFHLPFYDYLRLWQLNISETVHPNVLGGALVLTFPITVTALRWANPHFGNGHDKPNFRLAGCRAIVLRMALYISLLLQFGAVVLSQSRGSYLAIASALSVMVILKWPRLKYLLPVVPLVTTAVVQYSGLQRVLEQFSSDGTLGGWAGRLEIWQVSLMAIRDFPFTGIGIGTFTTVIPLLYPLSFPIESYPHAHNLFLQVAMDLGIPGLIAYLALLLILIMMLLVTLRKTCRHTRIYGLAIGAVGSMSGMLVHSLLDAVTWGTKLSFFSWLLFALIAQLFIQTRNSPKSHVGNSTEVL